MRERITGSLLDEVLHIFFFYQYSTGIIKQ